MTAVHALPRLWDGQRLLRFLAGLALVALAFAAHAGLTAPPAVTSPQAPAAVVEVPAAPAVDVAPATGSDLAPASVDVVAPARPADLVPAPAPAGPGWDADGIVPDQAGLRSYPERGPPQA